MSKIHIKQMMIENFKGIDHLTVDFDEKVNAFIGINGSGKSSILFALAMALSRFIGRIRSLKSNGILFDPEWIKNHADKSTISVSMLFNGQSIEWTVGRQRHQTKQTISNLTAITQAATRVNATLLADQNASIPVAVFYGVGRNVLDIPLRIKEKHIFEQLAAYDGALMNERSVNDFRLFFEWFRNREDIENEKIAEAVKANGKHASDAQLDAVRKAISILLPGFSNARVKRKPLQMLVSKKVPGGDIDLDIRKLSDGEKCTLALVGDLARRLSIANPALKNPLEGEGIVLIDEIDLHLHPQWECEILAKLQKAFPNCQFIVTTHSPLVLSRLEPENIYALSMESGKGIAAEHPLLSKGLSVNDILSSLMDTVKHRDQVADSLLKSIDAAIEDENIPLAKKQMAKLKDYLNGRILPEMLGQQASIDMLEAERERP